MSFDFKIQIKNQELQTACALSISEMFRKSYGHFSALRVWDCCDILGISYMQDTEIAKYLNIHHCMNFDQMQPEQIQRLKQVCFGLIGVGVPVEKSEIENNLEILAKAVNKFGLTLGEPEPDCIEFELVPNQY